MIGIAINIWRQIYASSGGGGPFLLLFNGTSKLLLFNGTSRLLITGTNPSSGFVPTFYILGF